MPGGLGNQLFVLAGLHRQPIRQGIVRLPISLHRKPIEQSLCRHIIQWFLGVGAAGTISGLLEQVPKSFVTQGLQHAAALLVAETVKQLFELVRS